MRLPRRRSGNSNPTPGVRPVQYTPTKTCLWPGKQEKSWSTSFYLVTQQAEGKLVLVTHCGILGRQKSGVLFRNGVCAAENRRGFCALSLRNELGCLVQVGFPEARLRRKSLKAEFALGCGPSLPGPYHEELGLGVVVLHVHDFTRPQPRPHAVQQDSAIADIGHAGNLRERPAMHVQTPDPNGERCRDSWLTGHGEEMVCEPVLPTKVTAVSGQCSGVINSGHLPR